MNELYSILKDEHAKLQNKYSKQVELGIYMKRKDELTWWKQLVSFGRDHKQTS